MTWIKVEDSLPKDDEWCWIFIPPKIIMCACYDGLNSQWYIPALDYPCHLRQPTHWQVYYTPAAPDAYDTSNLEADEI
jgi:hypothetical protein